MDRDNRCACQASQPSSSSAKVADHQPAPGESAAKSLVVASTVPIATADPAAAQGEAEEAAAEDDGHVNRPDGHEGPIEGHDEARQPRLAAASAGESRPHSLANFGDEQTQQSPGTPVVVEGPRSVTFAMNASNVVRLPARAPAAADLGPEAAFAAPVLHSVKVEPVEAVVGLVGLAGDKDTGDGALSLEAVLDVDATRVPPFLFGAE